MAIQIDIMSVDEGYPDPPRSEVYAKDVVRIGRNATNDLVLDHPGISSSHVQLRVEKNGGGPSFYLTDLESTNGTFVGNKMAPPQVEVLLSERDRVMIAGYVLRMQYVPDFFAQSVATPAPESSEFVATEVIKETPAMLKDTSVFERPVSEPEPYESEVTLEEGAVPSFSPTAQVAFEGTDVEIDFVATQLFRIEGKILHNSTPLAGVTISDEKLGSRTTDENGSFRFENILDGTSYSLHIVKNGFTFSTLVFEGLVDGADISVSATARRYATIRGRVLHRGEPLLGVLVDGGPLGKVTTDSSGGYEFTEALEGETYTLTASKDGFVFGTIRKTSGR